MLKELINVEFALAEQSLDTRYSILLLGTRYAGVRPIGYFEFQLKVCTEG